MHHHSIKMTIRPLVLTFFISIFFLLASMAVSASNLQKLKKGMYTENLAVYRLEYRKQPKVVKKAPLVPLVCPFDQTKQLEARLVRRKAAYDHMNRLKGYTIQLYIGSSRTAALKVQDLASSFSYPTKLDYRQPHYTVQLGFFLDRLEAYFVYLTLVQKIPNAMIRPCMRTRQDYLATLA